MSKETKDETPTICVGATSRPEQLLTMEFEDSQWLLSLADDLRDGLFSFAALDRKTVANLRTTANIERLRRLAELGQPVRPPEPIGAVESKTNEQWAYIADGLHDGNYGDKMPLNIRVDVLRMLAGIAADAIRGTGNFAANSTTVTSPTTCEAREALLRCVKAMRLWGTWAACGQKVGIPEKYDEDGSLNESGVYGAYSNACSILGLDRDTGEPDEEGAPHLTDESAVSRPAVVVEGFWVLKDPEKNVVTHFCTNEKEIAWYCILDNLGSHPVLRDEYFAYRRERQDDKLEEHVQFQNWLQQRGWNMDECVLVAKAGLVEVP